MRARVLACTSTYLCVCVRVRARAQVVFVVAFIGADVSGASGGGGGCGASRMGKVVGATKFGCAFNRLPATSVCPNRGKRRSPESNKQPSAIASERRKAKTLDTSST